LCHYGLSSGGATPLTFSMATANRMGGRCGQAEIDQELREEDEEVGNAFSQGTSPQGGLKSDAIEPQTRHQENVFRARDQASTCQDKRVETKNGGACRRVSIETPTGAGEALDARVCSDVGPRSCGRCGRRSIEAAAVGSGPA
jgi:hypothetical protein